MTIVELRRLYDAVAGKNITHELSLQRQEQFLCAAHENFPALLDAVEALKRIERKDYLKPGHSSAAHIARNALAPFRAQPETPKEEAS